jgi:solute carrier family 39 (zinc transporter), member 1/2/3
VQAFVEAYDLPLHIASVFIIAGFSLLGAVLPVLAHWTSSSHLPEKLLVAGNYFGTGVVIATAFVHMIPVSLN